MGVVDLNGRRVLCLSPHPDDTEFGVGATLHRFRDRCEVMTLVFSDRTKCRGELHNDRDQRAASAILHVQHTVFIDAYGLDRLLIGAMPYARGVIRSALERACETFQPDVIFCPAVSENHQDHVAIGEECVRICRGEGLSIFGYEVPKHNRRFQPQAFVKVALDDVDAKQQAVDAFSEFTNRWYFEGTLLRALAQVRAAHAGWAGYAEAFEVYRLAA